MIGRVYDTHDERSRGSSNSYLSWFEERSSSVADLTDRRKLASSQEVSKRRAKESKREGARSVRFHTRLPSFAPFLVFWHQDYHYYNQARLQLVASSCCILPTLANSKVSQQAISQAWQKLASEPKKKLARRLVGDGGLESYKIIIMGF